MTMAGTSQTEAQSVRFPILQGILPVDRSTVLADILAGITLAALAVPQVMGYTKIAGAPVITGLYTILIPMALFAIFGSSRHLVVGADSASAAILAGGLAGLAVPGSAEYVALCGVLACMAAVMLILARLIRLGFLADFLSRTVLIGFLTGVGVQVAISEMGGMLGLPKDGHGTLGRLIYDVQHLRQSHWSTLITSAAVLIIILGSRKISRKLPGPLIAVIGAITVSWAINLEAHGVTILGPVPGGMPAVGLPHVDLRVNVLLKLLPTAFSIFVVILAQSAATSRAYATRHNERFSENVDLVGLSLANVGAGLTGTFVVNGSPTMTQTVDSAGGRSQLAQITTSIIVLLVLLFLTKPLQFMPGAVLSAVVFLIGLDLVDVPGMRQIFRERPAEFRVALITAATVVFVGVEQGVLLAMFLSLVSHTRHGYRPKNAVIVEAQPEGWKTEPVATHGQLLPGLLAYRFSHSMYYANAGQLFEEVSRLAKEAKPPLVWFCIGAGAVDDIDYTAAATLRSLYAILKEQGIRLIFFEVSDEVYAQLERSGITDLVGKNAFYATGAAVFSAYKKATPSLRDE
ncbi:MAG: SulP family inorganic anion transporter [Syntrophobacteraceae bacterium]